MAMRYGQDDLVRINPSTTRADVKDYRGKHAQIVASDANGRRHNLQIFSDREPIVVSGVPDTYFTPSFDQDGNLLAFIHALLRASFPERLRRIFDALVPDNPVPEPTDTALELSQAAAKNCEDNIVQAIRQWSDDEKRRLKVRLQQEYELRNNNGARPDEGGLAARLQATEAELQDARQEIARLSAMNELKDAQTTAFATAQRSEIEAQAKRIEELERRAEHPHPVHMRQRFWTSTLVGLVLRAAFLLLLASWVTSGPTLLMMMGKVPMLQEARSAGALPAALAPTPLDRDIAGLVLRVMPPTVGGDGSAHGGDGSDHGGDGWAHSGDGWAHGVVDMWKGGDLPALLASSSPTWQRAVASVGVRFFEASLAANGVLLRLYAGALPKIYALADWLRGPTAHAQLA